MLNAGITTFGNRRKDAIAMRSAMRLVREEIVQIRGSAAASANAGLYGPEAKGGYPRSEWETHRTILAATLDADDWTQLSEVYAYCARVETAISVTLDGRPVQPGDRHAVPEETVYYQRLVGSADRALGTLKQLSS